MLPLPGEGALCCGSKKTSPGTCPGAGENRCWPPAPPPSRKEGRRRVGRAQWDQQIGCDGVQVGKG